MHFGIALLTGALTWAAAGPPQSHILPVPFRTDAAVDLKSVELTIDGTRVKTAGVLGPSDPQMLLLVLDLTGDTAQADPAKDAVIDALNRLPESTYVALLRAQDGLRVLVDPTPDRAALASAIRDLPVSGRPGLIEVVDGVQRLADDIGRRSRVRVTVVYVTDSDVTAYREDFTNPVINSSDPHDLSRRFPEQLIQEKISKIDNALAARRSSMHVVHIVLRGDRLNEAYLNGLKRLADDAGGTSTLCRTSSEIPDAISAAFRAASSEYVVFMEQPERGPAKAQLRIVAKDESGADVPLLYRSRISFREK